MASEVISVVDPDSGAGFDYTSLAAWSCSALLGESEVPAGGFSKGARKPSESVHCAENMLPGQRRTARAVMYT